MTLQVGRKRGFSTDRDYHIIIVNHRRHNRRPVSELFFKKKKFAVCPMRSLAELVGVTAQRSTFYSKNVGEFKSDANNFSRPRYELLKGTSNVLVS